jgi:hypothetical protein
LIPRYIEARLIDTRASLYIENYDRVRLINFCVLGVTVTKPKPPKLGDIYLVHSHRQSPVTSSSNFKLPKPD